MAAQQVWVSVSGRHDCRFSTVPAHPSVVHGPLHSCRHLARDTIQHNSHVNTS